MARKAEAEQALAQDASLPRAGCQEEAQKISTQTGYWAQQGMWTQEDRDGKLSARSLGTTAGPPLPASSQPPVGLSGALASPAEPASPKPSAPRPPRHCQEGSCPGTNTNLGARSKLRCQVRETEEGRTGQKEERLGIELERPSVLGLNTQIGVGTQW